jgi:hypothetical protein
LLRSAEAVGLAGDEEVVPGVVVGARDADRLAVAAERAERLNLAVLRLTGASACAVAARPRLAAADAEAMSASVASFFKRDGEFICVPL